MQSIRIVIALACVGVIVAAACSSDKPTQSTPAKAVDWDAGHVRLQADTFCIDVEGTEYLGNVAGVIVGGDGGDTAYCTLELEWVENGDDMRLYIYFTADATHWWADEIRTYDGAPSSDGTRWVYYIGEFFKTPKGGTFAGNVTISSTYADNGVSATLYFGGMSLKAF